VCLGVGELDSTDATQVVQVAADLIVGGGAWELCLCNEEIGLCDVRGRDVVAEQEYSDRGLGVSILPQNCRSQRSEQPWSDVDNW
jgi:hypothetical protein